MSDDGSQHAQQAEQAEALLAGRRRRRKKFRTFAGAFVVLVIAAAAGYFWWIESLKFETTDNAYVHATIVSVSTQIEGVVQEVLVDDNQAVNEGDLLVRIDPGMYRVAVERAEAEVAVARARYESSKVSVTYSTDRLRPLLDEAEARLARLEQTTRSAEALLRQKHNESEAAEATLTRARDELRRKRRLHAQNVISREILDQAVAAHRIAVANHKAATAAQQVEEQKITALRQQMNEAKASIELVKNEKLSTAMKSIDSKSMEAEVKQAEAKLKEARLRLSYTEIRAPFSGYVNKKNVEVGSYVEPGRRLLVIVPLHKIYIQANFREVQLKSIRVGQRAVVTPDAYPDRSFKGHVESIYSGTGEAFSLLPAENATGNWVKVVRRVPVKIVLDEASVPAQQLLIGMSVHVQVDVKDRKGLQLLPYASRADSKKNTAPRP